MNVPDASTDPIGFFREAAWRSGISLHGWGLRMRRWLDGYSGSFVLWSNRECVFDDKLAYASEPVARFVCLHELGHVNDGVVTGRLRLDVERRWLTWDGEDLDDPHLGSNGSNWKYARHRAERSANYFAVNHPLFRDIREEDWDTPFPHNAGIREHLRVAKGGYDV